MTLAEERKEKLRRLKGDFLFYAPRCLKVLAKNGEIVPFELNTAQLYVHERIEQQLRETGKVRALVLKGRQQGISTYVEARYYHKTQFQKGKKALILTHLAEATANLFAMTKRYHDNVPAALQPSTKADNATSLWFDRLDSRFAVATAGNKETGRGGTVQLFHGSEAAFWPNPVKIFAGLGQSVADCDDTEIILESTANGVGGEFHKRWRRAEAGLSEFIAIFVPWFWQEEYRKPVPRGFTRTSEEDELRHLFALEDEQIYWRRMKIEGDFNGDETQFQQEYPNTSSEAFVSAKRDCLISIPNILAARKERDIKPDVRQPLLVGCDPARYGDDRTAIVWRRGRCLLRIRTLAKKNTMQVTGILVKVIEEDKPTKLFIDIIGLGVGIYDRLVELGYGDIVVPVQASETADEDDRYRNKRAEMWCRMRDWFASKPVRIPDDDDLQADLVEPGYSYDSAGRILIESKESIKKRGGLSPDIGDALSLTFAEIIKPVDRTPEPEVEHHRPHDPGAGY